MKLRFLTLLVLGARLMAQSVPCGPAVTAVATGVAGTTTTDSTVVDGNAYYYVVAAVDNLGNYSVPCSAISNAAVVGSTGAHSVTLTWKASVTPGVTYAVFRATAPQAPASAPTVVVN